MREMIDFNGEKLRILREEKCLTQRELASHAGISQVYLSKIECNHIIPRRAVCEKLAWVLRVDPDEFFGPADETLDDIENYTRMFEKVRAMGM